MQLANLNDFPSASDSGQSRKLDLWLHGLPSPVEPVRLLGGSHRGQHVPLDPLVGEWLAQLMFVGFSLSQATLQRMYVLHVFVLTSVVTGLVTLHLAVVWMQGIAEPH